MCSARQKKAFFSGNPWECLIFFGTVEISTQVVCSCQGMDQKNDQNDVLKKSWAPERLVVSKIRMVYDRFSWCHDPAFPPGSGPFWGEEEPAEAVETYGVSAAKWHPSCRFFQQNFGVAMGYPLSFRHLRWGMFEFLTFTDDFLNHHFWTDSP